MTLNASIDLVVRARHTSPLDLSSPVDELLKKFAQEYADGGGVDQASKIFHDERTLAASANESLDLAGGLTDAFGALLTFAGIKGLIIKAAAGNTNDVLVGGAASNGWATWAADPTDVVAVKPGGLLVLLAPTAAGYAVTPSTGDLLKIANSSSGTSVTYDIIIIGD